MGNNNGLCYRIIEIDEDVIRKMKAMANEGFENKLIGDSETCQDEIGVDRTIASDGIELIEDKHQGLPSGVLKKIKELELNINIMTLKKERLKLEVCKLLGDAKTGDDGAFKVTRYYVTAKAINIKKLRMDFPEVYEMVVKNKKNLLNMRISKL